MVQTDVGPNPLLQSDDSEDATFQPMDERNDTTTADLRVVLHPEGILQNGLHRSQEEQPCAADGEGTASIVLTDEEAVQSEEVAPSCSDADASGSDYNDIEARAHCVKTAIASREEPESRAIKDKIDGQEEAQATNLSRRKMLRSHRAKSTNTAAVSGESSRDAAQVADSRDHEASGEANTSAVPSKLANLSDPAKHSSARVNSVSSLKRTKDHLLVLKPRKRQASMSRVLSSEPVDLPSLSEQRTGQEARSRMSTGPSLTAQASSSTAALDKKTRFACDERKQVDPARGTQLYAARRQGSTLGEDFSRFDRHGSHKASSSKRHHNETSHTESLASHTCAQLGQSQRVSPQLHSSRDERLSPRQSSDLVPHHPEDSRRSVDTRFALLRSGFASRPALPQQSVLSSDGHTRLSGRQSPRFDLLDPGCLVSSLRDRTVWTFWDCYAPVGTRDQDIVFLSRDDIAFPCAAWNPSIFSPVLKDVIRNPAVHVKAVLERTPEENRKLLGCAPVPCVRVDEDWQGTNFLLSFLHPIPALYLPNRVIAEKVLDLGIRYQVDRAVAAARHRLDELDRTSDTGDSPAGDHVDD